jgi:hypothetical protein
VDEGFPLLMLSRIIYGKETAKPVIFSQDFLRSDYARIHANIELAELGLSSEGSGPGKEEVILRTKSQAPSE